MSGNLIDLRRRIKSVKNTQKITRAMKTVSAAKLRRSTTDLNRNRPVVERLWELLVKTAKKQEASKSELTMERKEGDYLIVVLGSDKGLCGAFNSHIYKKAENRFKELKEKGEEVLLKLQLPGVAESLKIKCDVAWTRDKEGDDQEPAGMGIKFREMSKTDNQTLKGYLKAIMNKRAAF